MKNLSSNRDAALEKEAKEAKIEKHRKEEAKKELDHSDAIKKIDDLLADLNSVYSEFALNNISHAILYLEHSKTQLKQCYIKKD